MNVPTPPKISAPERDERQQSVDFARHSVRLEGYILSPEVEEINRRYVDGEIGGAEHGEAIRALYGPESEIEVNEGALTFARIRELDTNPV